MLFDNASIIGLLGLALMLILIMLRAPIALAMILVGILGNYLLSIFEPALRFGSYLLQFKSLLWNLFASYDLSVLPLFIFLGAVASNGSLSKDLFLGINSLFAKVRGGVAIATIIACSGFSALSGSSVATASTMGKLALPWLTKLKYSYSLSAGVIAAGGVLGILIPPSIILIIYANLVEISILKMFQAAIIPGIIAVLFFSLTIFYLVLRNPNLAPLQNPEPRAVVRRNVIGMLPVVIIFLSLIVGLGLGLFSPTPAAAFTVLVVIVYGFIRNIFGEGLNLHKLKISFFETAKTTGMIYFILFAAEVLKSFATRSGLTSSLVDMVANSGLNHFTILILILSCLILLGCVMESLTMILIVIPYFWPVMVELNGGLYVDAEFANFGLNTEDLKIWFGILVLIVIELGLITPPIGLNLFVIKSISNENPSYHKKSSTMKEIFKGSLPFCLVEIVRILLIIALPSIALFLPNL